MDPIAIRPDEMASDERICSGVAGMIQMKSQRDPANRSLRWQSSEVTGELRRDPPQGRRLRPTKERHLASFGAHPDRNGCQLRRSAQAKARASRAELPSKLKR